MSELDHTIIRDATSSVKRLQDALEKNRLAHAILLHGKDMQALEKVMCLVSSKLLNCPEDKVLIYPDFFSLRPLNKMRQISVDKTRELIKSILQSPSQGERKVAVVYEADRMNKSAANAFLKTLEEPPLNTTIFLLTSRPYALLDTIRSRCLSFRLSSSLNIIEDLIWEAWLKHYAEWTLHALKKPASKVDTTNRIMSIYRMIWQFESTLKRLSKEVWDSSKSVLPEGLSDEEELAQKSGLEKQLCYQMLSEIESATYEAILAKFPKNPPVNHLNLVLKKLEETVSLIEVNCNVTTILETFFLYALRTWPS